MAAVILTPVICTSDAPLLRLGSDSPRKEGKRREFNFTLAVLDRPTDREKMPAENAHDIEPAPAPALEIVRVGLRFEARTNHGVGDLDNETRYKLGGRR